MPITPSDPQKDRPTAGTPPRIGRLLGLIGKLMDYGRHLAGRLQRQDAAPISGLLATVFGTTNTNLILARIIHGLHLAAALQLRLTRRAADGREPDARSARAPSSDTPRPARSAAAPLARARDEGPGIAHLPTSQEIAAQIRHRPVGAVIADICRDFGIFPGRVDRALWDDLVLAIVENGGSVARLLKDLFRQVPLAGGRPSSPPAGWPMPQLAAITHAEPTGPP